MQKFDQSDQILRRFTSVFSKKRRFFETLKLLEITKVHACYDQKIEHCLSKNSRFFEKKSARVVEIFRENRDIFPGLRKFCIFS